MKPLYQHTAPKGPSTYLGSANGKDYYHRSERGEDIIDIRTSDRQGAFTSWVSRTLIEFGNLPGHILDAFNDVSVEGELKECTVTVTDRDGKAFQKTWGKGETSRYMIDGTLGDPELPQHINPYQIANIVID